MRNPLDLLLQDEHLYTDGADLKEIIGLPGVIFRVLPRAADQVIEYRQKLLREILGDEGGRLTMENLRTVDFLSFVNVAIIAVTGMIDEKDTFMSTNAVRCMLLEKALVPQAPDASQKMPGGKVVPQNAKYLWGLIESAWDDLGKLDFKQIEEAGKSRRADMSNGSEPDDACAGETTQAPTETES